MRILAGIIGMIGIVAAIIAGAFVIGFLIYLVGTILVAIITSVA